MFQHSGHLKHLLPPHAYFSPEWYEQEQTTVFRSLWNFACLASQVARDGDQLATRVAGVPVVIVNRKGKLSALQNICAHRHSQVVADGPGRSAKLRCQIHGWEYDERGRLSHLPDGRSFVGMKAADYCLRPYRVERCGPLVFVSLSIDGPSCEEYLGAFSAEFHRFYDDVRQIETWVTEHPVNWKVVVENAVESYHVPMVHPKTFEDFRPEEYHDHELQATYTRYGDLLPYDAEKSLESLAFRVYSKLLIRNATFSRFSHVHLFPNLLLYFGDLYRIVTVVEPLSADRCRYTTFGFVPTSIRGGALGRSVQSVSMKALAAMVRKILREDMDRWPPVQEGLKQSSHRGVLSAREERVFAFQQFIVNQMHEKPRDSVADVCDASPAESCSHSPEVASCER
jgi:choline monooxygenase